MFHLIKLLFFLAVGYCAYEFMIGLTGECGGDDDGGEGHRRTSPPPRGGNRKRAASRSASHAE